jgi:hypothetical protein
MAVNHINDLKGIPRESQTGAVGIRPILPLLSPRPVLSPTRITLENNEKIRPQPDRENAFAGASGGGNATAGEPSLG